MGQETNPVTSASAPGRVELLGNHTDYNQGVVLGAAINRGITVTGRQSKDGVVELSSADFGQVEIASGELRPLKEKRWANYSLGVADELRKLGAPIDGFVARVTGDLPIGAGLSSSAAVELATALFLLKLFPHQIAPLEIAKACQRAEHHFVGVHSGLLDQVISLFGRANHAVFFDSRTEEVRVVPFPASLALIIAESGKKRQLASGDYNLRREQTHAAARALSLAALRDASPADVTNSNLPEPLKRRALHVVEENERVWQAIELLRKGDGKGFGRLMNASHESSRRNFENSTPELDLLVAIARQLPGVLGARLTGGGFGGATVTLCQRASVDRAAKEILIRYRAQSGLPGQVFVCQLADGAR